MYKLLATIIVTILLTGGAATAAAFDLGQDRKISSAWISGEDVVKYSFGDYYAVTNFSFNYGTPHSDNNIMMFDVPQAEGMDFALQAGRKINNLTAGLLYVYTDIVNESAGSDFRPLYFFTAPTMFGSDNSVLFADRGQAFYFYAGYELSRQINISGALGFTKTQGMFFADNNAEVRGEKAGWALKLDASFKLFDNLIYEAHFGYADSSGMIYERAVPEESQATLAADPVYQLTHHLTMTF